MRTEHHSGEEWLSATELGEWLRPDTAPKGGQTE
jgi:hypothetical protein